MMRRAGVAAVIGLVLGAWGTIARPALAAGQAQNGQIARGKYIVDTGGCHDCHTPKNMGANGPEPDTARLLSGFPQDRKFPPPPKLPDGPWVAVAAYDLTAWSGPWGISYTANLTPDKDTGIGNWTPEVFISAIRTGKHMGVGRPILPPMPWETLSKMTDEDLRAVFAYLKSLPPVKNAVPAPAPPAK